MQTILAVLAVILVLAGFVGFFFGVVPTIIAWVLAGLCVIGAWKARPSVSREDDRHLSGPPPA